MRVGTWEAEVDLVPASRDACRDVEEREPETLASTGPEWLGKGEDPDPAGDVVGKCSGEPPAPVAEEVLKRSVVHSEIVLQLADCLLCGAAPEAMVVVELRGRVLL